MDDIQNTQQLRLYNALCECAGEQVAREIALKDVLKKYPSDARKAAWAEDVCADMEARLDADTVTRARMMCHCQPPLNKFAAVKRAYERSHSLEEYVRLMDEANESAGFWIEDGEVYMSYPRCYCSFVNKSQKPLPKSWCLCSLGYVKALHDHIFDADVKVELLESVITGGDKCVMKITLPNT